MTASKHGKLRTVSRSSVYDNYYVAVTCMILNIDCSASKHFLYVVNFEI